MRATPPAPPLSPGGVELVEQLDEEVLPNFAKPSAASIARATEVRNKKEADHESSLVVERARAAATFAANRASEQKRRPSRGGTPKPTPRYASPNAAAKVRQESTKAKSSALDSIRQRTEQKEESDEWRKRRKAAPPQANTAEREAEVTPAYAMPTLSRVTTTAATTARRAATTASGGTLAGRLGGIGGTTTAQETQDESEVWKRNRAAAVAAAAATAAGRKAPPTPTYALPTRAAATRAATESVAPSAMGTGIRGGAAARLREEEAKQQAEIFRRRTARKRAAKETGGGASTTVPRYAQATQATGARRASASGPELAGRPVAIGESTRGGAYEKDKRAERDAERLAWRGRGSTKSPPASARFASATESSLQRSSLARQRAAEIAQMRLETGCDSGQILVSDLEVKDEGPRAEVEEEEREPEMRFSKFYASIERSASQPRSSKQQRPVASRERAKSQPRPGASQPRRTTGTMKDIFDERGDEDEQDRDRRFATFYTSLGRPESQPRSQPRVSRPPAASHSRPRWWRWWRRSNKAGKVVEPR